MAIPCTMLIPILSGAISGAPKMWDGLKWVGRQIGYVWNCESNIQNLTERVDELKGPCKDRLQHSVEAAEKNGEEIEKVVMECFERINKITEDANGLVNQLQQRQNCLFGFCPNVKSRYQLSKKAKKEMVPVAVQELERAGKFTRVGYRTSVKSRFTPVEGFEGLKSRKETFDQVLKALSDPGINKIGVYGLGGVGKSTLLKHVAVKAEEGMLFDQVVMVNVRDHPDVNDIQQTIADKLCLRFDELSLGGRADRLFHRLKKENKILVILDNVLGKISFEDIGIPPEDAHKGCKILMSSRYREVLSDGMGTQTVFLVNFMPKEEAWSLFQKMAGDVILSDERLRDIATQVAERCGGMPITIVTVASTLKNKSLEVWKDALKQLPVISNEEMKDKVEEMNDLAARLPHLDRRVSQVDPRVYLFLELCLEHLKTNEAKSLFLLCGQLLLPYVAISDLVKYSIGLGLVKRIKTMEEASNRVINLVSDLVGCCLLLEGDKHGYLQMHDTVQSFGVLFASKSCNVLNVHADDEFKEWPSTDFLQRCTAITLERVKIHEVPEALECPLLNFICLRSDLEYSSRDHFLKILKGAKNLKVLDLTRIHLLSLRSPLHLLKNLQTLCLYCCVLGGIDGIGELKTLKILSLFNSIIAQLPEEISQLTNLELLDLTGCTKLRVIPANVLSSLVKLEALYMRNSFVAWDNARLAELKDLHHLTTLELHIPDANVLPRDFFSKNLERYKILIGDVWDWSEKYQTSRMLKLKLNTSIDSSELYEIKALLKKTEDLHVDELKGVRSVLYNLEKVFFPNMEYLNLCSSNIERIWQNDQCGIMSCLTELEVTDCGRLKSIFPSSIVQSLVQLKKLCIRSCKSLEEVLVTEEVGEERTVKLFPKLDWLELKDLPKLARFCSCPKNLVEFSSLRDLIIQNCPDLKTFVTKSMCADMTIALFGEKMGLPSLKFLEIDGMNNLEKIWNNLLVEDSFCGLETLLVSSCTMLLNIFPSNMLGRIERLKKLVVSNCGSLEEVFEHPKIGYTSTSRSNHHVTVCHFQNLATLEVSYCCLLESLVPSSISFHSLTTLEVSECHGLKHLITPRTAKSLVQLARLSISECGMMTEVITNEGGDSKDEICFSHLKDLRLHCLSSLTTFCSGNYTFEFPSLEYVLASQCPEMRTFFGGVTNTPKLEKIRVEEDTNKNGRWCWEGNLNATVQRLFTEQDGSRSLTL